MTNPIEALRRLIVSDEGQYFDRQSLFQGPPGAKKQRDRRAVRDQVAEYVAGFANADGGTLVLGVEDDGTITGCPYDDEGALQALLDVPAQRLVPPLKPGRVVEVDGMRLLVFDVAVSVRAVMVQSNGFPLRQGDQLLRVSEEYINRQKEDGLVASPEGRVAPNSIDDLDLSLLQRAMDSAGFAGTPEEYLVQRRLADPRGEVLVLRQAAVWLFAKSPGLIQHPNLGVRVFRVHGTEQKSGTRRNVQDFPWIDDNLLNVLDQAYARIDSLVRKSTKLHDLFFRETPEYPPFTWQEALVNALAHRDYTVEGMPTEVHLYDDRLEVTSPGELLPGVKLEDLETRRRLHRTRNPRLCRVLAELGLMRQQGEGIPRIIEEMEESWLPSPKLEVEFGNFRIILRNKPIFELGDEQWNRAVRELPYSVRQRRALVAFQDREFQSGDYQRLNGVDRDVAYRELQELEKAHLLASEGATRGRKYRVRKALSPAEGAVTPVQQVTALLRTRGHITNQDYRAAFELSRDGAKRVLAQHVADGELISEGSGRGTKYLIGPNWPPGKPPKNGQEE